MAKLDINMTDEEIQVFVEILESEISDLRMEIANTDSMEYRDKLKQKKMVIRKVLTKLLPDK